MNLSPVDIARYAYNAGFRGLQLVQAVAVALAESRGDPAAYNPESGSGTPAGSGSRGLWQVYGAAHPEYNNQSVFDPQANADAAFHIYQQAGNSFSPWTTFKNGGYLWYLTQAQNGVNQANFGESPPPAGNGGPGSQGLSIPPIPNPLPAIGSGVQSGLQALNPLGAFTQQFSTLADYLTNPGRVVKIIAGLILVGGVLIMVAFDQAAKHPATAAKIGGLFA